MVKLRTGTEGGIPSIPNPGCFSLVDLEWDSETGKETGIAEIHVIGARGRAGHCR